MRTDATVGGGEGSVGLCNLVKVMRQGSCVTQLGCECCLCTQVDTREEKERLRADTRSLVGLRFKLSSIYYCL